MKYIIFDLDHTLLDNNKKISLYTYNILTKLQSMGHKLVANTARNLNFTIEILKPLKLDYAITNGGALVSDLQSGPIYKNQILKEEAHKIIEELLPKVISLNVDSEKGIHTSDKNYQKKGISYFDFNNKLNLDLNKIVVKTTEHEFLKQLAIKYDIEHSRYINSDLHRLSPKGCSKWNGILEMLKYSKGNIEDTIIFGDDIGDLEMLENAGLGVAMSNSIEEVLSKIKTTTKSNEEDGVAIFLQKHFKINL